VFGVNTVSLEIAARYVEAWWRHRPRQRAGAGAEPMEAAARRALLVDASADPLAAQHAGPHRTPGGHPAVRLLAPLSTVAGPDAVAVLLREDPVAADAAHAALEAAGWAGQVRRRAVPEAPVTAAAPEVQVCDGSLASAAEWLPSLLDGAAHTLVRAAPQGPAPVPFSVVHALVARSEADLLLALPLGELQRLDRYPTTPVADLPLHLRRAVEAWSACLGHARLAWLAEWRALTAEQGSAVARQRLAEHFAARLAAAAPGAVVRAFTVPLGGAGGITAGAAAGADDLHLVVATHEPMRVLHLNRILFELRTEGRLPWIEPADPLVRFEDPGVLELFGDSAARAPAAAADRRFGVRIRTLELAALAGRLAQQFADRQVPLREIVRGLAHGELVPDDLRAALRLLRRERRAAYGSLASDDAVVRFHPRGDAPEPAPARRRSGGEAEPGLWG
jgi:hypothetical protein